MSGALRSALPALIGALLGSLTWNAQARPPKRDPPLLFGGPVTKVKAKVELDPRLPTGVALPVDGGYTAG